MRAVVVAAVLLVAGAGAARPQAHDPSRTAIEAAGRLQDAAHLYRNGLRTGASTAALEHLLRQLARDLEAVEEAHGAWAPTVAGESREAADVERQAVRRGCSQMHDHVRQMSEVLCSDPDDHARMAALAIEMGRQAGRCEKSLRAMRRLFARPVPYGESQF